MAESIFKVGDIVTIKKRTQGECDYRCGFTDSMASMAGRQVKIAKVYPASSMCSRVPDDGYVYTLENLAFSWASSMFEDPSKCPLSYVYGCSDSSIDAFIRKRKCPQLDFSL